MSRSTFVFGGLQVDPAPLQFQGGHAWQQPPQLQGGHAWQQQPQLQGGHAWHQQPQQQQPHQQQQQQQPRPHALWPTQQQQQQRLDSAEAIDASNIGHRLLKLAGWKEGSGLGAQAQGIVEPVQVQLLQRQRGLGFEAPEQPEGTSGKKKKKSSSKPKGPQYPGMPSIPLHAATNGHGAGANGAAAAGPSGAPAAESGVGQQQAGVPGQAAMVCDVCGVTVHGRVAYGVHMMSPAHMQLVARGAEATWGTTLASQVIGTAEAKAAGRWLDMIRITQPESEAAPCQLCKGGVALRGTALFEHMLSKSHAAKCVQQIREEAQRMERHTYDSRPVTVHGNGPPSAANSAGVHGVREDGGLTVGLLKRLQSTVAPVFNQMGLSIMQCRGQLQLVQKAQKKKGSASYQELQALQQNLQRSQRAVYSFVGQYLHAYHGSGCTVGLAAVGDASAAVGVGHLLTHPEPADPDAVPANGHHHGYSVQAHYGVAPPPHLAAALQHQNQQQQQAWPASGYASAAAAGLASASAHAHAWVTAAPAAAPAASCQRSHFPLVLPSCIASSFGQQNCLGGGAAAAGPASAHHGASGGYGAGRASERARDWDREGGREGERLRGQDGDGRRFERTGTGSREHSPPWDGYRDRSRSRERDGDRDGDGYSWRDGSRRRAEHYRGQSSDSGRSRERGRGRDSRRARSHRAGHRGESSDDRNSSRSRERGKDRGSRRDRGRHREDSESGDHRGRWGERERGRGDSREQERSASRERSRRGRGRSGSGSRERRSRGRHRSASRERSSRGRDRSRSPGRHRVRSRSWDRRGAGSDWEGGRTRV